MKLPLTLPPASQQVDFIALGENSLDILAIADDAFEVSGKTRLNAVRWLPGGQAATAAIACARLGWRSRYIGSLGDDPAAEHVRSALSRDGVDARLAQRRDATTRTAIVLVDGASGTRTVLEYRDANLRLSVDDIDPASITSSRLLLVDAVDVEASAHAAQLARAAGIPTIVDADAPATGIEDLLQLIDVIILPERFAQVLTGAAGLSDALASLAGRFGASVVVATLGERGSLALCKGREIRTAAPRVPVRDTTGAGDAFRAGFAAGWLETAADAEIEHVLTVANAVAALNCREIGAQTGLPTRGELAGVL